MELASKLREILGKEIVADDPETVAAHSGDKWFATHRAGSCRLCKIDS